MYIVSLVLNVYYGPAKGYRHEPRTYTSDTIPDLCTLRRSAGVFDVGVYNTTTSQCVY